MMDDTKISNTKISILFYSSFMFITNVLAALIQEYYIYSLLFANLTITSVMFHTNNTIYTNILDKISILAVVFYGGGVLYNKINAHNIGYVSIIVLSFLLCNILYFYGYYNKKYCYDPNKKIGDQFHCWLHIISSFGHHFITFL